MFQLVKIKEIKVYAFSFFSKKLYRLWVFILWIGITLRAVYRILCHFNRMQSVFFSFAVCAFTWSTFKNKVLRLSVFFFFFQMFLANCEKDILSQVYRKCYICDNLALVERKRKFRAVRKRNCVVNFYFQQRPL